MKWFKRICLFIVTMFLLALPTLIFKTDLEFYNSLVGPKIPPIVFVIVWSIIDICVSIFFFYTFVYVPVKKGLLFFLINIKLNLLHC